jgi:hypothetical protein
MLHFPKAIPFDKSEAQRSVGIAHAWKFTFAVRSERGAGGKVDNHVFCTAKHVTWFESHGETGPGGVQTFRVDQASFKSQTQASVKDREHGPHFDRAKFMYSLLPNGDAFLQFLGWHQTWGKIGEPDEPVVTPGSGTLPAPDGGSKDAPPQPVPEKPKPDPKP